MEELGGAGGSGEQGLAAEVVLEGHPGAGHVAEGEAPTCRFSVGQEQGWQAESWGPRRDAARERGRGLKQGHPRLGAPQLLAGSPSFPDDSLGRAGAASMFLSPMVEHRVWEPWHPPAWPWAPHQRLAAQLGGRGGGGELPSPLPQPSTSLLPETPSLPASPTNCARTGEAPRY